jgi:hypothetical protein
MGRHRRETQALSIQVYIEHEQLDKIDEMVKTLKSERDEDFDSNYSAYHRADRKLRAGVSKNRITRDVIIRMIIDYYYLNVFKPMHNGHHEELKQEEQKSKFSFGPKKFGPKHEVNTRTTY